MEVTQAFVPEFCLRVVKQMDFGVSASVRACQPVEPMVAFPQSESFDLEIEVIDYKASL
jgi:hypothetical protein